MTRQWEHVHEDKAQAVDVLGWHETTATVIATRTGWLTTDAPTLVRIRELRLFDPEAPEVFDPRVPSRWGA